MEKFSTVNSVIAFLEIDNIDTDMIIPKQFLTTIKRTGLKDGLFYEMRYDNNDNINQDFILHNSPYDESSILVAGDNFGCGSSREHAPWALLDFGFKVIIAPSFADIFYNNCFKNGILPIASDKASEILNIAKQGNIACEVNLEKQIITIADKEYSFDIDKERKHYLLEGLDDISLTLVNEDKITAFEKSIPNFM